MPSIKRSKISSDDRGNVRDSISIFRIISRRFPMPLWGPVAGRLKLMKLPFASAELDIMTRSLEVVSR
jgi:hypothetical protein